MIYKKDLLDKIKALEYSVYEIGENNNMLFRLLADKIGMEIKASKVVKENWLTGDKIVTKWELVKKSKKK